MAAAGAHGIAVLAIRVYAAGALASGGAGGVESNITTDSVLVTEQARARAAFATLGPEASANPAETALRFALSNDGIACAVIGAGEIAHIETALAAAKAGPLSPETLARLEPVYETGFAA